MKVHKCYACKAKCSSTISLFRFPRDSETRSKWAEFCCIGDASNVKSSHYLCSRHFRREDLKFTVEDNRKRYLKKDAIPSIVCDEIKNIDDPTGKRDKPLPGYGKHKRLCCICGYICVTNLSVFTFPLSIGERSKWAEFCRMNLSDVKNWHCLCEIHFSKDSFRQTKFRRLLKKGTIPTIRSLQEKNSNVIDARVTTEHNEESNVGEELRTESPIPELLVECTLNRPNDNPSVHETTKSRRLLFPSNLDSGSCVEKIISNQHCIENIDIDFDGCVEETINVDGTKVDSRIDSHLKCPCGMAYRIKLINDTLNVEEIHNISSPTINKEIHNKSAKITPQKNVMNHQIERVESTVSLSDVVPSTPVALIRRRPFPRYFFDIKSPDVETPEGGRLCLRMGRETILKLRKKNQQLQSLSNRLKKKLSSLSDSLEDLISRNLLSAEAASALQFSENIISNNVKNTTETAYAEF